jgi:hypothetical protein
MALTGKELAIFLADFAGVAIQEDPSTRNLGILPSKKVLWDPIRTPEQMQQVKDECVAQNIAFEQNIKVRQGEGGFMEAIISSNLKLEPTVFEIPGRTNQEKERALGEALYIHKDGVA